MNKEIKLLEEAENLLKTEAFMECSAAERCQECVTKVLNFLKQQLTGEFTTRLRNFVNLYKNEIPRRAEITLLEKACDRLDRAEAELKAKDEIIFAYESVNAPINPLLAINKDLLEACEKIVVFCESKDRLSQDDICPTKAYESAKDAIAKAKKEG